ncbi:hypothetical protein [Parendozoicomonas sp. Alg238-R29]|uniref:hypothetical protein n=1 Tax=Parendozoicomonas sp. Alg238-R29 TaxID=2993446 RepID=UPI00248EC740|nr:hypothetical protein [Parendozoicomonas sp. Alg238-R29]
MDSLGRSSGVESRQDLGTPEKTGQGESVRTSFSSGSRSVSHSGVTVSLNEQQDVDTESTASDTELSQRSIEDVTDKKPGRMKQATSWLGGKAKSAGISLKDGAVNKLRSGRDAGKALAKGTAHFAQHPMQSTKSAVKSTGQYASSKYQAAKGAGSAAKKVTGAGLQALKENPRGALKAGAVYVGTGIKSRAVSFPGKARKLIPSRPKGLTLANAKKLLSRSAKQTPPSPSASVKQAVGTAGQKLEAIKTQSTERSDTLQQAKGARDNTQLLNKLLDDPAVLNRSRKDFTVRFPGGEVVQISGSGVERAQSVKDAVGFANKHRAEIRRNKEGFKQLVNDLKKENKKVDAEDKQAISKEKKTALDAEKTSYQKAAGKLKREREDIRNLVGQLKGDINKEMQREKESIKTQKDTLTTNLTADTQLLKAQEKSVKKNEKALEGELKELKSQLTKVKKELAKFDSRLDRNLTTYQQASTESRRGVAKSEVGRLSAAITEKQLAFEEAHQEILGQISELTETVDQEKVDLKGTFSAPDSQIQNLEQQLKDAEEQLKENTRQIKRLQRDYQASQKEIKKLK